MSTPSRSFTSGASFATRLSPSKIAFTSSTSKSLYAATACGKLSLDLQVDRHPAVLLEAVVDAPRLALDRAEVLGVLGDLLPRRVEQREQPDAAVHLRVRVEVELERAEAAHDVLRRIGAVDAQDRASPAAARASASPAASTAVALRELVELARVDGDRRRRDDDAPPVVADDVARPVGHGADDVLGRRA